jgi:sigma-B regulation protein RsbU (phosphoserine phosphatase)
LSVSEPGRLERFQRALDVFEKGEGDRARVVETLRELVSLLERTDRRLQAKEFLLQNLFDLSRELTGSFDEQAIKNVVSATMLGHLLASRCALYEASGDGYRLIHERGVRLPEAAAVFDRGDVLGFGPLPVAFPAEALPGGRLLDVMRAARFSDVVRLVSSGKQQGFFLVGGRVGGAPLLEEDREYAITLGRQALAALEAVRLHRMSVEKERQDRELQIARGIQQGLLPKASRPPAGFDLAARSESCFEVGGDYYDVVPLEGGRLGLVVADVSGKGTPASLLMASVHASIQALAGSVTPADLMKRLNRFLYLNTQANRYVTLFYSELDPERRRLAYVNAGHVPPFVLSKDGAPRRLVEGGPVLGLLEDADFDSGELEMRRGDLVAILSDGATEALSDQEEEFGDARVIAALGRSGRGDTPRAQAALESLFESVQGWAGARGCSDDLTALVLAAC